MTKPIHAEYFHSIEKNSLELVWMLMSKFFGLNVDCRVRPMMTFNQKVWIYYLESISKIRGGYSFGKQNRYWNEAK